MALSPGTPAQASAWSTYLVGRPTPMPSTGGSSVGADGCGRSLAPGALCWMPNLCVHRRIRGLARGGDRGRGQLRAAEGEPGRTARQAAGLQPRQAGEVAATQEGAGTRPGGRDRERWGHG